MPSDQSLTLTQRWARKNSFKFIAECILSYFQLDSGHRPSLIDVRIFNFELKNPNLIIPLETYAAPDPLITEYSLFHAAVLSTIKVIDNSEKEVSADWIMNQVPEVVCSKTAGILFGIGLKGKLGELKPFDYLEILGKNHSLTSSAVILGLALAKRGSLDLELCRLASVHLRDFEYSETGGDLSLELDVQVSAILAVGFLYQESISRGMSNYLMHQIGRMGQVTLKSRVYYTAAYSLAAGLSLGLVNLASGSQSGIGDSHLKRLLVAANENLSEPESSRFTTPASLLALALIFMKSGNEQIIESIRPSGAFRQYKPVHYALRIICVSVVTMKPCIDIESVCELIKNRSDITYECYSVIAAALFLGISNVGTRNKEIYFKLLRAYQSISKIKRVHEYSIDFIDCFRNAPLKLCADYLLLALSLVMAGSGDCTILGMLRDWFGSPMDFSAGRGLIHFLSLGFLSIRGMVEDPTDSETMAMLICTCFPVLPTSLDDQSSVPLCFRYFWALAFKPISLQNDSEKPRRFREDVFINDSGRKEYYRKKMAQYDYQQMDAWMISDFYSKLWSIYSDVPLTFHPSNVEYNMVETPDGLPWRNIL